MGIFYVYAIRVDGVVRYIGKGKGRRCTKHLHLAERLSYGESLTHKRVTFMHRMLAQAMVANSYIEVVVQHDGLDEDTAFDLEEALIRALGRDGLEPGGLLWNRAASRRGGKEEGMRAALADPRVRERLRAPRAKWKMTPEQRAARAARLRGKSYPAKTAILVERNRSDEQREIARRSQTGKPKTNEHRAALSAAAKAATATEDARKRRAANLGNPWSDPEKRAALIALRRSPEFQARRRASIEAKKKGK